MNVVAIRVVYAVGVPHCNVTMIVSRCSPSVGALSPAQHVSVVCMTKIFKGIWKINFIQYELSCSFFTAMVILDVQGFLSLLMSCTHLIL